MRLLLISNSTNFGENYLAWASAQIELFCLQNHINKESRIIFVPFAGVNIGGKVYPESYDAYEAKVKAVFSEKFGLENLQHRGRKGNRPAAGPHQPQVSHRDGACRQKAGETVQVQAPRGTITYEILEVMYD